MNDVLDDSTEVSVTLGVVQRTESDLTNTVSGARLEDSSSTLTLSSNNTSHVSLSGLVATMVKETELYDRLAVQPDASEGQIKKAYRKMAMKYHPDKNAGDPEAEEKFKSCSEAYEILSDEEKRTMYDRVGLKGMKEGGGGMDPNDIFSSFFGGGFGGFGGGGGRSRGPRKTRDVVMALQLTLEELYNGVTKSMRVTRKTLCKKCKGSGSKSGKSTTCPTCQGSGVRTVLRQFGPGMMARQQVACDRCEEGEIVTPGDRCLECHGAKLVESKKILKVEIDKGTKEDKKIVFRGESDEAPGYVAGDVVFVVKEKKHAVFERHGIHLVMEKTIPLVSALCGFSFTVKHLDERVIHVSHPAGQVIKPDSLKELVNEGFPIFTRTYEHGSLFIKFNVTFPDTVAPKALTALRANLPDALAPAKKTEAMQSSVLQDTDISRLKNQGSASGGYGNAYEDSDSDDGGRDGGVQCAQQ
eukprot:TRINITY_DN76_c0_g1_i1.p1 TRINITY_DN76_c0_g1~~TRINITY_DN76_c0_g1_i1.p1  ORF type:complete len:470 (-),score=118.14 TRINITY_DN76_c0_g1_i1:162-1571(-)